MVFSNRLEAGRFLADRLLEYKGKKGVVVLAIPRGGIETGFAIARELGCSLDVVVSKKIPFPGQPEVAIGAVCNEAVSLDEPFISLSGISDEYVSEEIRRIRSEVRDRYGRLNSGKDFPEFEGKTVILTDDGIATGHTFEAAADFIRSRNPLKLIAAVPVGPPDSGKALKGKFDDMEVIEKPVNFMAVGQFYRDFRQLSDGDVLKYLNRAGN